MLRRSTAALIIVVLLFSTAVFAAEKEDKDSARPSGDYRYFIPQEHSVYKTLADMAEAGLITSKKPGYFEVNALNRQEAGKYILEAWRNIAKKENSSKPEFREFKKTISGFSKSLYPEIMKNVKLQKAGGLSAWPEAGQIKGGSESVAESITEFENALKYTTYDDTTPFRVWGSVRGKWSDLDTFGVNPKHFSEFAGSYLELNAGRQFSKDVKLELLLNFAPNRNDPSLDIGYTDYQGSANILDNYTLYLTLGSWNITAGIFWEDLTALTASQNPSDRPWIFERDQYSGDTATRDNFETMFRQYFQTLDYRWSKHPWMGVDIVNYGIFGKDTLKLMAGKAEEFYKNYKYEFGARYTRNQSLPFIKSAEWSGTLFNASNDRHEIDALSSNQAYRHLINNTVAGGDMKGDFFRLVNIAAEFEYSTYNGKYEQEMADPPVPLAYRQKDTALVVKAVPKFMPKVFYFDLKYLLIGPDYRALAAGVADTSRAFVDPDDAGKAKVESVSYVSDPTILKNNLNRIEVSARLNIPYFLFRMNYCFAKQIRATGNSFYSKRYVIKDMTWWNTFYSNYGFIDSASGAHANLVRYNENRYPSASTSTYRQENILNEGTGGLTTDEWHSSREFMASSAVTEESQKTELSAVFDMRTELSRFIHHNRNIFLHVYGELQNLVDGEEFLVNYDPSRLFSKMILTSTLIYNPINKLSVLGYYGLERWASNSVIPYAVDYVDTVYGIGFDLDVYARTGFFTRLKYFEHKDEPVSANNFHGWQLTMEVKSFF